MTTIRCEMPSGDAFLAGPGGYARAPDRMEECKRRLRGALLISSHLGVVLSLVLAGFLGIFASDSPSSTVWDSVAAFALTLLLVIPPLVILPRWGARRVLASPRPRLAAAIVHSLLMVPLFPPLGLVMATVQLYYCARLMGCRTAAVA